MATKINEKRQPITLRNASDPFKIQFTEKPYFLTKEQLLYQADSKVADKRHWDFPTLEFISFEDHTLILRASRIDRPSYYITILIEPESLYVSCSCGMSVEKLCVHALKTLERIFHFDSRGSQYFEKYRPDGIVETCLKHPEYFKKTMRDINLHFTPKKLSGGIYRFSDDANLASFTEMLSLPEPSGEIIQDVNTTLTYIIVFSNGHWKNRPPFIVPCLGILTKSGHDIKSFDRFLTGTGKDYEHNLTENERFLNNLCYEMWQQAENANRKLLGGDKENLTKLTELFNLWQRALPYLRRQEHIYRHPLFRLRYLKGKPMKNYTRFITIGRKRPEFSFKLTDKGAYFRLDLKVTIGGKMLSKFDADLMFFIKNDYDYHLVTSLKDVGILEWMRPMKYSLNIFKEHFEEFQELYLNQLKQYYPIN